MTLTRADIISEIQDKLDFTKRQSTELTEQITEIIKSTLAKGEDVLISGFGKFSVKDKKERRGRNPATGQDMMLKSRRVVSFKVSGKLRKRVNEKIGTFDVDKMGKIPYLLHMPRIDASGVLYHIVIRGSERKAIFKYDTDREDFIARLLSLPQETVISGYAVRFNPAFSGNTAGTDFFFRIATNRFFVRRIGISSSWSHTFWDSAFK